MRRTTFRQMEIFSAIARLKSFTRAAEELHLTQPTVSMQMKKLEETVGLPLVEQIGKRIFLTGAGNALHGTCREIFDSLDRFEMLVADMKGMKKGYLRIGVVTTAKYFAPRLLGPFCQRYPGVDISLKVTNRERVLERIAENLDDVYIMGQPPENLEIHAEPFLSNPLVALAARDHPLAGKRRVRLKRFVEEPLILREPGSGTRIAFERLLKMHGFTPHIRMELGSNEAIKQAVAGGLGVAVLSKHTLALEGHASEPVILDVEHLPIARQWHAAYAKDKRLSVIAETFLEYLREAGADLERKNGNTPTSASLDPLQRGRKSAPDGMA
ncbi:MAG: LysR substrate-binding domain-containing protein [Thiohalobacteraceae bacterium]